jgi:hypothetical protein
MRSVAIVAAIGSTRGNSQTLSCDASLKGAVWLKTMQKPMACLERNWNRRAFEGVRRVNVAPAGLHSLGKFRQLLGFLEPLWNKHFGGDRPI